MSYDVSVPFTDEQIDQIYKAGCTIGCLRDFYSRFPDQDFDTALGGCLMEAQHKAEGATIPLESELQETVTEPGTPIDEVIATVEEKLPEAETTNT